MTEAVEAKKEIKDVQVNVGKDLSTATLNGTKIEISPDSNVVVYTNEGVQTKPASATPAAATEDKQISIGKDFNTVAMYGATIELAADGSLIVSTNGKVQIKPAPANDTSAIALMADGKQQIFAMPTDLSVTQTFNDGAKSVKKLNVDKSLGHDDWQIPSLENLRVLQKNQDAGALKGTFTKEAGKGSDYAVRYWSSTEDSDDSSSVHLVRFPDGVNDWDC